MVVFAFQISQISGIPNKLVRLVVLLHVESPIVDQMAVVDTIAKVLRAIVVVRHGFWQKEFPTPTKNNVYK